MTCKDYKRAIDLMKGKSVEDYSLIANYLIEFFSDNNPKFDIEKFARETIKACHTGNMFDENLWNYANMDQYAS